MVSAATAAAVVPGGHVGVAHNVMTVLGRPWNRRKINCHNVLLFSVREFIVLTMTTAAMYSMSIHSLDVWERVTLSLAEI